VTAWQEDALAAAAGRGRLRASLSDREQVVDALKTAFVQGRLTKDELDSRVGQALASPTCAGLAVLTADLPTGLTSPRPPDGAAAQRARLPLGKAVLVGLGVLAPLAVLVTALVTRNEHLGRVFLLVMPWYFIAWIVTGLQMLEPLRKRSDGQLAPRPARRCFGRAPAERERAC
jgi:hypothetical protein